MRIISLLASGTEIVCALGAGHMLVGRSHECDNPAWVHSLPACSEPAFDVSVSSGDIDREVRRRIAAGEELYRIHSDLIASLQPDLVIAQSHCEVCAVTPADVERTGASPPMLSLSAFSVADIFDGINRIAERIGTEERGSELVAAETARLDHVRSVTAGLAAPSVAIIEWADPLFAMGNWGPELIEIANGRLCLGQRGEYSASITGDQLAAADPEFMIVAPCGFSLARSISEQSVLEKNAWWNQLRAVRAGKVAFADGNLYFNRSGMTIARTAEIIAEILHGVECGRPSLGEAWQWMKH